MMRRVQLGWCLGAVSFLALSSGAWAEDGRAPNSTVTSTDSSAASSAATVQAGAANQSGAADQTGDTSGPDIVVTGVRGAQRAAIEIKRDAPQILDSIVAEDIGKLPDVTIADSLQRVPGVQISRDAGEGSAVNIRGLPQVLTTLNGEIFLGGQNITTAQPNLEDIPATLFAGVDVIKSPISSQVEGGVSGSISLKTRRPLDLHRGLTLSANAENTYGLSTHVSSQLVSGLASYNAGDRFGILVAASYSDGTLLNANNVGSGFQKSYNTSILPAGRTYYYNRSDIVTNNDITRRKRLGVDATLQYRPTDSLLITGDVFYTHLSNRDYGIGVDIQNSISEPPLLPGSIVDSNGVLLYGVYNLNKLSVHSGNSLTKTNALNTNLEIKYDHGGPLTFNARWVHGSAHARNDSAFADSTPFQQGYIARGAPGDCNATPRAASCVLNNPNGLSFVPATVDFRGTFPVINFGGDIANPANYQLQSTWGYATQQNGGDDAYRLDAKYDLDIPFVTSLEAGARYARRDASFDNYNILSPIGSDAPDHLYFFKDPLLQQSGLNYSIVPQRPFSSVPGYVGGFSGFGFGVPNGVPAVNPAVMNDAFGYINSLFPGSAYYEQPAGAFSVSEKVKSFYVEANLKGHLLFPVTGNVGVRYVDTRLDIYGDAVDASRFIGNAAGFNGAYILAGIEHTRNETRDWLPSANLNFAVQDDVYLRLGYAKTVGRLDLSQLGVGLFALYFPNGSGTYQGQPLPSSLLRFGAGSAGNPNLKLPHAEVYNSSLEWYVNKNSVVSVGAFLFNIASFVEAYTSIQPRPDSDGVVRTGGPVSSYINGTGGTIKGIEANFQTVFDFLPGVLSGLGTQLNYTYSDSGSANKDLFGRTFPVPDNAKHQANAILFYQKGPLQARGALNYRSSVFKGVSDISGDALGTFQKPTKFVDASMSYDVTPRMTVYLQGTNLTGESQRTYLQFPNQYSGANLFERRVTFGVRIRN